MTLVIIPNEKIVLLYLINEKITKNMHGFKCILTLGIQLLA